MNNPFYTSSGKLIHNVFCIFLELNHLCGAGSIDVRDHSKVHIGTAWYHSDCTSRQLGTIPSAHRDSSVWFKHCIGYTDLGLTPKAPVSQHRETYNSFLLK